MSASTPLPVPLRVVIAEDSAVLRDGLVQLLVDRGFIITGAVADAEALRRSVERDRPDVAVVDIRMPPTFTDEGLRAAIELRRRHQGLGILLFSQYIETRYAAELLADDAAGIGYLLKDRVADVSDFVEALVRVASGGTALDPEVVTQLLGASRRTDSISVLSAREREVLSLMAEGRSNAAIARRLVISEGAVEKHVANIFTKLDLPVSQSDHRRVPGRAAVPRLVTTPGGTGRPSFSRARSSSASGRVGDDLETHGLVDGDHVLVLGRVPRVDGAHGRMRPHHRRQVRHLHGEAEPPPAVLPHDQRVVLPC